MLDSKPTLFGRFFINCDNFNQSLNCWDVSRVENMLGMFHNCASFNQPLDDWDVSSVIKMEQMFVGCTSLTTLPHWYRA
ncbi:BspA family leucine-rich repeat surface protein [Helicobacter salomonis]|uniref:BspA family leucine-rich repeat surface protein n=1 Tax=Helicobacter salomonis TaxID=56878 RepID=UPI000CF02826|nr:BspA family leucine-rich repeat surface protein [Helicobacter salomonis]